MTYRNLAYVTLVTQPSYLAGVIILAFSLKQAGTQYPLLVLFTESLGDDAVEILTTEATRNWLLRPHRIEPINAPDSETSGSVAERFRDTYTKLRAFDPSITGVYEKCVFLDADVAAFKNPDSLFNLVLPSPNGIAASHACVCNLDRDKWADKDWTRENCPHTPLTTHSRPNQNGSGARRTYKYFNSGVFVWVPSLELWDSMMQTFRTDQRVMKYKLPDQDFLNNFFQAKWRPLSWRFNAVKTMRNWHPILWDDNEVALLHYIVDKPWERRIASDSIAGSKGLDGETHRWWWKLYAEWESLSTDTKSRDCLANKLAPYVAAPLTAETDKQQIYANLLKELPNGATFRKSCPAVD